LSVPLVYAYIHKSNSTLRRKSKKLLEDSIARVLGVMKQDAASENEIDSVEGDYEKYEATNTPVINGMNKEMVALWGKNASKSNDVPNQSTREQRLTSTIAVTRKRQSNEDHPAKRRKAASGIDRSPPTHVSCEDLGGADGVIKELTDLMVLPLLQPEIYIKSKIEPPRGILLHGPPGCGKTMVAHAFAAELGVPFIPISAPSIVSGMSGESEKALREHFEEARRLAPCLIFIDEIDSITPKRESAQREMEKRIVAQLLTCMDDLALEKTGGKAVIVLAATNRPDALDPALRRGGRFDKEINLGVPNEAVREMILRAMTRNMLLSEVFPFRELAKQTPGFVGADLKDLVSTAGAAAIKRYLDALKTDGIAMEIADSNEMEVINETAPGSQTVLELRRLIKRAKEPPSEDDTGIHITFSDFQIALPKIQPSAKREGFATIPETTWAQIGALRPVREELLTAIVEPIRSPEKYERVGITAPTGVLLWGPPGCGKTLLAKAVANESKANFISVKGPELLNKYVGESEKAVRQVFDRARSSVPCVIFFDELDALVPKRDESLSESSARVVNTLLAALDGLSDRQGIYVIAATNRPDIIDPAMLRPGRLETLLFVDLPEAAERVDILRTLCRNTKTYFDVRIGEIAENCEGFSGADLEKLLKQAGYAAIKRNDKSNDQTTEGIIYEDFVKARGKVGPSVSDRRKYDRLKAQWGAGL
jgi:ribosome biogenesis ATPase